MKNIIFSKKLISRSIFGSAFLILAAGSFTMSLLKHSWKRLPAQDFHLPSQNAIIQARTIRISTIPTTPRVDVNNKLIIETNNTVKKMDVLNEILKSKNDNDPRLDQDFNNLSTQTKEAMEREYTQLHLESRNERGTIVFIVGKNLQTNQDFDFLAQVVTEEPCLSLSNCNNSTQDSPHIDGASGIQVTLEYPQIVALKSIENYLDNNSNSPNTDAAIHVLQKALMSKSPMVNHLASSLLTHHKHLQFS